MSAATLVEQPVSHTERQRERDEKLPDLEAWACGFPADARPEARERCQAFIPELIIELL